MSNPTVFELNKQEIRNNIICIEDNIGESVHFHIGMVRFDLTVEEFLNVTNTLSDVLGNLINIENFVLKEPLFLWNNLYHLCSFQKKL